MPEIQKTGSSLRLRLGPVPAIAVVAVAAIALSACGGSSGGAGSSGKKADIKVAQITTISGGYPFGDTVKGTQSYVSMINDSGGVDGHKIVFESGDDKGQASEASQLARKFVQQDGVLAMVGNTSLADCDANKGFYSAQKLAVIGGGTQPNCFSQPNWMPVNAGPYIGHEVMWDYTFKTVKPSSVCQLEQNDPTAKKYYTQLRNAFVAANPGAKFTLVTYNNDASKSPVPAVTQAKQAGCDMIMLSTVAPNLLAFVKAAKAVGLDASFMCLGSCYDATLPKSLGKLGEPGALGPKSKGIFVAAELAPIDDTSADVQAMITQFQKTKTPANFWSEIGWLSAAVFVDALKQNTGGGDITKKEGVLKALQSMQPYKTTLAATPLTFGSGAAHAPNLGSKVLLVKGGKFSTAEGQSGSGFTVVQAPPAPQD